MALQQQAEVHILQACPISCRLQTIFLEIETSQTAATSVRQLVCTCQTCLLPSFLAVFAKRLGSLVAIVYGIRESIRIRAIPTMWRASVVGVPVILVLPGLRVSTPLKKTVLYLGGRARRGDEGGKCNERMKGEADGSDTRIRICLPARNGL